MIYYCRKKEKKSDVSAKQNGSGHFYTRVFYFILTFFETIFSGYMIEIYVLKIIFIIQRVKVKMVKGVLNTNFRPFSIKLRKK